MAKIKDTIVIALVAMFSSLSAVLTYFTHIPSPTGGYTHIGDTAIYIAALLFGTRVGALVGIVGPLVTDLVVGYPRWYVTVVAHGLQGFIAGFGFRKKTWLQVTLALAAGLAMSLTYFIVNVYVKGWAPALLSFLRDFFGQTLISVILSIPVVKTIEKIGIQEKIIK
ncbi:MAG: ECF transporter S component [Thermoproteales archaeon]|nr:ECF transporter S component [Thermoproteales archaeon]